MSQHLLVKEGEVRIPNIRNVEPLKQQADYFADCIVSRKKPLADARSAADVVRTLEQVQEILEKSR